MSGGSGRAGEGGSLTVYVDNMRLHCKRAAWWGHWSNLWADSTEELVAMGRELGLADKKDQVRLVDEGLVTERLMVTETMRLKSIKLGAVPLQYGGAGIYKLLRRKREQGLQEKGM